MKKQFQAPTLVGQATLADLTLGILPCISGHLPTGQPC
jgi:hypothetical protein